MTISDVTAAAGAMRTPISRVRWVTVTNMMFMMPMPLMTSAMEAITSSTSVNANEMVRAASRIELRFSTL